MSPDGAQIAVISNTGAGTVRNLSLVPTGGGAARTIYTTGDTLDRLRWYPSGDAFLLITENRQANFFRLNLPGGPARQLTRFTRG